MSKYIKAQNADTNSLFDWDIAAITRSDQIGKMNDESSALRSKLFWIKLPDGKKLVCITCKSHSLFVGRLKSYRINKILKESLSCVCRSKKCNSRISLYFDTEKIFVDNGKFSTNNSIDELNDPSNYR